MTELYGVKKLQAQLAKCEGEIVALRDALKEARTEFAEQIIEEHGSLRSVGLARSIRALADPERERRQVQAQGVPDMLIDKEPER